MHPNGFAEYAVAKRENISFDERHGTLATSVEELHIPKFAA